MSVNASEKYHLKKFIAELEQYRGRHTELVTVYIPEGYEMAKIINHLAQEQGTATNIKSAATRKNVIDALEKMIQHLRLFDKTPPHGLAVFSGNVAEREGQQDFKVWSIEPPIPLRTRIYRCDKEFLLDLLREMMDDKEVFGLVVMDRRDGDVAMLKGKTIIPVSTASSNVPGKTKAGGQSAHRFERLREGAAKDFYKKIADMMKDAYLGLEGLKGIIVGGPGPTKYDFLDGGYITTEVRNKVIAVKDLSYTGEFGLQELLDKSDDVLAQQEVMTEKKVMNQFFNLLSTKPGMVGYGYDIVKQHLQNGVVETLLISETIDEKIVDELSEIAEQFSTEVQIISTETREGVQLRDMGRIAAILRFEHN